MARVWKDLGADELYAMRRMEFTGYTRDEMLEAVKDSYWQEVRQSMKGLSTRRKLITLRVYLLEEKFDRRACIQVNNYLDALRRGGLLPPKGWQP